MGALLEAFTAGLTNGHMSNGTGQTVSPISIVPTLDWPVTDRMVPCVVGHMRQALKEACGRQRQVLSQDLVVHLDFASDVTQTSPN